jgi:TatD DNase family protein
VILVDTHAHLDFGQFDADREDVWARAQTAGVRWLINPGADLPSSRRAVALAEGHAGIFATVGIHPHEAESCTPAALAALRQLARSRKVVAIGEIGLDYYRDLAPRPTQRRAFRDQLELAVELRRPVVIHDRDAHGETLAILREFAGRLSQPAGVLHAFSGDAGLAAAVLDLGFYIAVGGPITFPNARQTPALLAGVPLERLLLETDCPYLAPQRHRGQRNEPAYLPLVAERLAEILHLSATRVAAQTTSNARALFGLPEDA